jgi:hypothetical protein
LKEKDTEANFEMFDVAMRAEILPHFYMDDLYKITTLTTQ